LPQVEDGSTAKAYFLKQSKHRSHKVYNIEGGTQAVRSMTIDT